MWLESHYTKSLHRSVSRGQSLHFLGGGGGLKIKLHAGQYKKKKKKSVDEQKKTFKRNYSLKTSRVLMNTASMVSPLSLFGFSLVCQSKSILTESTATDWIFSLTIC